jgi:hypothetical protein
MHVVYGPIVKVEGLHEDAHVLLRSLGRPSKLFEEGAAMLADHGEAIHDYLLDRLADQPPPPVAPLVDDAVFKATDPDLTYPLAGSFVAFLLARHGTAVFQRLYPSSGAALAAACSACGTSLETLEAEWHEHLRARADHPARDRA